MQPPFVGSHVRPVPQAALFGVCEHVPFVQVSVVQPIKSSQPALLQQAAQPTPGQHVPPLAQVVNLQTPPEQLPV